MTHARRIIFALLLAARATCGAEPGGIVCMATDGDRTVTFVAATPNFTLEAGQSIHPQLKPDFRAQWSGFLKIEQAGNYRLILTDGKNVTGQQTLKSDRGLMPLNLTYERKPGIAEQQLWWESDFFRAEPVPWYAYVQTNAPPETGAARRLERGRQLIEDFNCAACHRTDKSIFHGRAAPDLSDAGSRLKKEWTWRWLGDPRHFRSSALMPALLRNDQERADVTAFLDTLRGGGDAPLAPATLEGKAVFDKIGCAACHGENGVSLAGEGSKYQTPALARYLRDPLACDPGGRMPGFLLTPDEANALAQYLTASRDAAYESEAPPGDAARGRQLMQDRGCLNCHTLQEAGRKLESKLAATPLAALRADGGCLSHEATGPAPNFHLTDEERAALAAFLASPDVSPAPAQDVARWMAQFQCAACHAWHGPAGLPFGRDQEPPALSDAGNKLRRSWIEQVLTTTNRVRPWLHVRMPQFGAENVAVFFDGFAGQAGATLGEGPIIDNPRVDLADEGMHYIGTDEEGLSCITCHAFRGEPSQGDLHSPDLTTIDDRIRTDWLQRWLFAPARITPGTAMPEFFASKPEWEAQKMVHRLLQALAMGAKMPDAPGWRSDPRAFIIAVSNAPVLQRCFLPDVSPRAIAVGLPSRVSYAFDAASCQLRYAWTGDFLDAKPVWTWRGGLPPRVLGKKFYVAPSSGGLRVGTGPAPEAQFRGYELVDGFPRFTYDLGTATITLLTTTEKSELVCAYQVSHAGDAIYFQGGPEAVVTADPAPERRADQTWKLAAAADVKFTVRVPIN